MNRREVLGWTIAGLAGGARLASAQTHRRARVGWLSGGPSGIIGSPLDFLKQTLHELGWRLGDNLEIEERHAQGDASRLPRLAAELVATHPDVLGCTGVTEAKALQAETAQIPIVFFQIAVDPVAAGLVENITRPGGNITGFLQAPQLLSGKRFEIITELLGRPPRRLAYIVNPRNVGVAPLWADAAAAATSLGAEIQRIDVSSPAELSDVIASLKGCDAVVVHYDFMLVGLREQLAELAVRQRLPVMYENRLYVAAGGLMSYGPDIRENYRNGASYLDRLLKGARPKDLPVVQASRFELVVNSNAAKAIALTIPPSLLARADEVIE
jgi:putative tryptophan/tyrosine transport system substrate-binding protein